MSADMSPAAIRGRLDAVSELAELRPQRRLYSKLDMSPEGVRRRLERVSELNELCRRLRRCATAESHTPETDG